MGVIWVTNIIARMPARTINLLVNGYVRFASKADISVAGERTSAYGYWLEARE